MSAKLTEKMKKVIRGIREIIENTQSVTLTTHMNPDGDAIGSTLALYHYIKSFGKEAKLIIHSPVPYNLKFLKGSEDILQYTEDLDEYIINSDTIFVVDLNDVDRTKSLSSVLRKSNATKVIVDHHIDPKPFADTYLVETDATSAGELIYRIINDDPNDEKLTKAISECLYTAIMTDTGSFRFPRTDGDTHRIIGDLIDNGADPVTLYENIYNIKPERVLKLIGRAFSSVKTYYDGKLCLMTLRKDDFHKSGAVTEDVEDIVEQSLSIEGVQVGVLFSENIDKDEIRISFRSKGEISVRDIAAQFNGGGHFNAAGARVYDTPLLEVQDQIIKAIAKVI